MLSVSTYGFKRVFFHDFPWSASRMGPTGHPGKGQGSSVSIVTWTQAPAFPSMSASWGGVVFEMRRTFLWGHYWWKLSTPLPPGKGKSQLHSDKHSSSPSLGDILLPLLQMFQFGGQDKRWHWGVKIRTDPIQLHWERSHGRVSMYLNTILSIISFA